MLTKNFKSMIGLHTHTHTHNIVLKISKKSYVLSSQLKKNK